MKSPAGIKTRQVKESRMSESTNVFTPLRKTAHPVSHRNDTFYLRLHRHSLPSAPVMDSVAGFTLRSISPKGTLAIAHVQGIGAEQRLKLWRYVNFTSQNRALEDLKSIITGTSSRCTGYLMFL